jgi:HlyD family secretion protein
MRRHILTVFGAAAVLVGSVGILGGMTELSGAVVAEGSLVVESDVKKVQHPTGGVVGQLFVEDGDRVKAGDLLVRLDATVAQSNLDVITRSLWELAARRARLEAERDGESEISFPADLVSAAEGAPDIHRIIEGERKLFELRREARAGQKAQFRQRIAQLNDEEEGLRKQLTAKAREIELVDTELGGVRELWQKNLVQLTRLTAMEREAARLRGEQGVLTASLAQTGGKISETELQIIQVDQTLRSDVAKELADIRAKTAELSERKVGALDQLQRIDIRAPQTGIVHQLSVHTKGGVITAGEQIMLIVPASDALVVEARVAPRDIDQLRTHQQATLRFPSFNRRTTPELNGTVERIAADTSQDPRTGTQYYSVRVAMAAEEIARLDGLKLVPGMPVDAFIRTGDRTMLSYLFKPFADQAQLAFRQR